MRNSLVAFGALVSTGLFLQCTSVTPLCQGDACPPPPPVTDPPDCDRTVDPKTDTEGKAAACMVNASAIFVDKTNGKDDGSADGSRERPVASINKALTILAGRSLIYICGSDTFGDPVELTSSRSAFLFGGYECGTWEYDGSVPKVRPAAGTALKLTSVPALTISDLSFESQGATNPGESSIAIFIARSTAGVMLRRVAVTAGVGQDADPMGPPTSNYCVTLMNGNAPPAEDTTQGGTKQPCTCGDGTYSVGGKGGDINEAGDQGQLVIVGGNFDGAGGAPGTLGSRGADANTTAYGGGGAADVGELLSTSWNPRAGSVGANGLPGQGGGGGGGDNKNDTNLGGGGGGAGGCGGAGGLGGAGGGASIAIANYESKLTLSECTLTSNQAGRGGQGGKGQDGQAGGSGYTDKGSATRGGRGGAGSGGGGGGGGAGGISVGVVSSSGSTLIQDATTINFGSAGDVGTAGLKGKGGVTNGGTTTTASTGDDGELGVAKFSGPIYPPTSP